RWLADVELVDQDEGPARSAREQLPPDDDAYQDCDASERDLPAALAPLLDLCVDLFAEFLRHRTACPHWLQDARHSVPPSRAAPGLAWPCSMIFHSLRQTSPNSALWRIESRSRGRSNSTSSMCTM